jgi:hypothetical protein
MPRSSTVGFSSWKPTTLLLVKTWIAEWDDLGEFEIVPVIASDEAVRRVLG